MSLVITEGFGSTSGGQTPFIVINFIPGEKQLAIAFSAAPILSGPALTPGNWLLGSLTGHPSHVKGITVDGSNIILETTPQTNGDTYTLYIPQQGIFDIDNRLFQGPYAISYTAIGEGPEIVSALVINARKVNLTFNKELDPDDASDITNYAIDNELTVVKAVYRAPLEVDLTTSLQTFQTLYTLTANIRDIAGNLTIPIPHTYSIAEDMEESSSSNSSMPNFPVDKYLVADSEASALVTSNMIVIPLGSTLITEDMTGISTVNSSI